MWIAWINGYSWKKIPQQNLFKKNICKTPEHVKNPDMEQSDIVNTKSFWNHTEER